jgi:hypothetical protein
VSHVTWGEIHNAQGFGGEKPVGRTPLRCRRRCENINKTNHKEVECDCGDWICFAQDRGMCLSLVTAVMNVGGPKYWRNFSDWIRNY